MRSTTTAQPPSSAAMEARGARPAGLHSWRGDPPWAPRRALSHPGVRAPFAAPRRHPMAQIFAGQLRFGVHSGPQHTSYADYLRLWQTAERLGYDWASVF